MNSQTGTVPRPRISTVALTGASNSHSRFRRAIGIALACGVGVIMLAADANPVTTNQPSAEPVPARSVFVDDPEGKDPFFPNSTRRFAKKADVVRPALKAGPESVRLGGIVGNEERRTALINNQGFVAGEERKVRVPGGREEFLLRCVEIRDTSVVVTIDGGTERYEIQMAEFGIPLNP
jgi:hypothetical protein